VTRKPLQIAIVCFPTSGGSGVIAADIGLGMVRRGHFVHFIGTDPPSRFTPTPGASFHRVEVRDYPAFQYPPYTLALASKMIDVAISANLDILHVHYALPHATSALLARTALGNRSPKIVTTLHGTDVTIIGSDPSYLPVTRMSVERSDVVTVPSNFLRDATRGCLDLPDLDIQVIPNFVDCGNFVPPDAREPGRITSLFQRHAGPVDESVAGAPTLVHASNFRPVKRVRDVVAVFERVNARLPCRLLMIGDGPDRPGVEDHVKSLGLEPRVRFLGHQDDLAPLLQHCDVFVLPSETESFGLAALEAMACGVPVVASDVGGLPELVGRGEGGHLAPCGDIDGMAAAVLSLLETPESRALAGMQARSRALTNFRNGPLLDAYESCYWRALKG
jgi:N-acetyl-alpha-D-glucosaminyl L-malate synthase BshA